MVGNPGPTNLLLTVDQLNYQRDHLVPGRKAYFESRLEALREAYAADPVEGERLGLRNRAFSLSNSLKAYTGRLAALRDPQIMARKGAAETALSDAIQGDPGYSLKPPSLALTIAWLRVETSSFSKTRVM